MTQTKTVFLFKGI